MRIAFMGSAEFAVPALRALAESPHEIMCVYSQPPRPKGRGLKLTPTALHACAETYDLPVRTPQNLQDPAELAYLQNLKADVLIVVAYGLLIPQAVLDVFTYGGLNIHPSLLPRWRGAAPIERAIAAGDKETGVSIMQMTAALDAGDIVAQEIMPLDETMTARACHEDFSQRGAALLLSVLDGFEGGAFNAVPQAAAGISYAEKWDKAEARLDFRQTAEALARKIRAADSLGGCYFLWGDERVKIWHAEVGEADDAPMGAVSADWQITCGASDGKTRRKLRLLMLQKSGSKAQSAAEFARAYPVPRGLKLTTD